MYSFTMQCSTATQVVVTIKYHHGRALIRELEVKYMNVSVFEYITDLYKVFLWDLLEYLKELGFDIKKYVNLFYMDARQH